ncbi:hypothetical protein [Micromonospora sp. NPDC049240]|uniref:hypothetical protein n=1 Tax=Micromonospora sp. NPDC049240 TaxID=3155151 RepID=UPI0033F7F8C6
MTQVPRVEFPVWDVAEQPLPLPLAYSSMESGGSTFAVGLTRGTYPEEGVGVSVWSFAPSALEEFPHWPLEHAALAFAAPLATAEGISTREAVERIRDILREGSAATLEVDGTVVAAAIYQIHGDWQVVVSTEPGIPVAVACSGRELPSGLRIVQPE